MNLVIVESPTKARTIGKFLGSDYTIKASMGHLVDLPKSKLSVDIEHSFAPDFQVVEDKKLIIADLKSAAKGADSIILATDPDREGEAIASHIADILTIDGRRSKVVVEDRKSKIDKEKINLQSSSFKNQSSIVNHLPSISRIVFHEITKEAIEEALKNPRSIDKNLVNAQTARRVLDRLVGYKLSPLLWQKIRRGLSAGRVQSVALRLIVEREREIEKFKKEPYYTIHVILNSFQDLKPGSTEMLKQVQHDNGEAGTTFELIEISGEKIEVQEKINLYDGEYNMTKTTIDKDKDAQKILDDLQHKQFVVSDVLQKEMHRSPQPPYTTSTLQQDASRRLGFFGKRTMRAAQKLYEEGYITYHRTDSVVIGNAALLSIRNYAKDQFGEKYIPEKPHFYTTKQKLAQEAHEAIRPTRIGELQSQISNLKSQIGGDAIKLYEIIWKRAVASQMSDAIIESTAVLVSASPYALKANGSVLVFDGFLKVNPQALQDNRLSQFIKDEQLKYVSAERIFHETTPPPRYNDASLIKTLEEKGIGRPSTYAPIISTIEERQYIERTDARFTPTSVGVAVSDFLVAHFADIDDIPFTAEMEDHLDSVAHGKKEWVSMMKDFYTPFEKELSSVKDAPRVKIEVEETSEICPKCGANLVVRTGRFGKFLSCSTFPKCDFKKTFVEETPYTCPRCKSTVIIKKTRKGRKFFGCSNYPTCNFAAWKAEDIIKPQ